MSDDPVRQWLERFRAVVPASGRRRRRVMAEVEEHLRDAAADAARAGAGDPATEAVRRMGPADQIARTFRRPPRRIPLALVLWLPAAVAATIAAGTSYVIGQHVLRQDANDPQVQLAEEAVDRLYAGVPPSKVAAGPPVDIAWDLGVNIAVFDDKGQILASTARLDGAVPRVPLGALNEASGARNEVTWQPRPGVRQAVVIIGYGGAGPQGSGAVVVARSLRLVEERESVVLALAVIGWLGALAAAAAAAVFAARLWSRPPPPPWTPAGGLMPASPASGPGATHPATVWRGTADAV